MCTFALLSARRTFHKSVESAGSKNIPNAPFVQCAQFLYASSAKLPPWRLETRSPISILTKWHQIRVQEVAALSSTTDLVGIKISNTSLCIIKRLRRRRRVKNREGEGGGGGGHIILSPPKAKNFWVCSKFGFLRSLDLDRALSVQGNFLFNLLTI